MKYASKDQAFMIRGLTEDERAEDENVLTPEERENPPEFYVKVSQVSRGWWTRKEVTALRDRLNEVLGE